MKSEKCIALGLTIQVFVVVFVVEISCQTTNNYHVGFEHVNQGINNHSGNATHYNHTTHKPIHVHTTVVHHPVTHKVTTHRTTHRTTTTLLPIIVQTGFNEEVPSTLYQNSPLFKSATDHKFNIEKKKVFDNFLRNHIKQIRAKAGRLRQPVLSESQYYFVTHTYYNKRLVNKISINNRTFVQCENKNTSTTICLPNSHAICSDNGIIMCITLLQQTSPCAPYSLDYCTEVTLPCATDDVPCVASNQQFKTIKVPCAAIRTVSNSVLAKYTIPNNPFDIDPNAICITVIVEPKLLRSPISSLAGLGYQLANSHFELINKVTTLKPASVGVTQPINMANQTQQG